jgi:high-affinity Fe2+/Pb2+ permease
LVPLANLPKLHPRRYPIPAVILAAACAAGLAIIAFYYLVAFTGDLRLWLDTGINRMFLPAGMLLLVWLITLTGEQERAQSR